ncbi:MAG: sulfatase-like hydrolase/transferase [Pirellulaceae bacterium]
MRHFVSISIIVAAFALFPRASDADQRPNIVIILADDLGYGDLSCYGAKNVQTPHIDRLAEQGMRFTDAHSPHSVCTPTRYALLTGRYAWRTWVKHRCVWSDDPLLIDTDRLTLPKLLKSAGYQTACLGKWHLGFGSPESPGWDPQKGPDYNRPLKPGPLECGFDYFFGIPHVGQHPHVLIENHDIVGLDPQDPIHIVLDERNRKRKSYRDRQNVTPWHEFTGGEAALYKHEDLAIRLTKQAVDWIERQESEPFLLYFAPRNVHSPLNPHPRFAGKSEIGTYGDFILELDWSIGEILEALQRKGYADNTLVLFSSDNGGVQAGHRPAHVVAYSGHKANGPLRGQKTEVYEGGHRVPLIARWPGRIQAGSENDSLVALLDVFATSAALLGQDIPAGAAPDSFSFLHELLGGEPIGPVRDHLIMNANDDNGYWAVREGDWKLILGRHGGGSIGPPRPVDESTAEGQLYNLGSDLAESNNLYRQHPKKVAHLTSLLQEQRIEGSYQSRSGHPADHLPPYIRRVCGFGERPDWSHDGKRILFVEKPMGEVYELDMTTGLVHPKTRHFLHHGFTRALYLANGDILLAGPKEPFDPTDRQQRNLARDHCWLSVLEKQAKKEPVPLGLLCAEGPAVSRSRLRIAWTLRDRQKPEVGENHAQLLTADVVYEEGVPKLKQERVVFDSHRLPFRLGGASLETQNFVPPDDEKLIFSVYRLEGGNNTETFLVDTATGDWRNLTQSPDYYDEPEGVFPDGLHTCVEHAPSKRSPWPLCDIYKLKLDGSGRMQRLTHFSDFHGYKASQGVVSDDGKRLCFQIGKSGDEAGVGYGFFVMDLEAAAEHLQPYQTFEANDRLTVSANRLAEFTLESQKAYGDPFNAIQLDAVVATPSGRTVRIPAFWAGGSTWKIRYASGEVGEHTLRTECTDRANADLHGRKFQVRVTPYEGDNPLYEHGPLRVADDGRRLAHADGTPFFWLGDTWWMGLTRRLHWPQEFQTLAADRKKKGFNVVQIVAGLYPDMPAFDERGANEAGFPWTEGYSRIRPEYFDAADRRLMHLADEGFVPCIVGAWGYHLHWMGQEKMRRHWRHLIARYGALPVVWCAAGEASMGYYQAEDRDEQGKRQVEQWSDIIHEMRELDGFERLITVHPGAPERISSRAVTDSALIDFELPQTGHRDLRGVDDTAADISDAWKLEPPRPVINGEFSYEQLDKRDFGGDVITSDITRRMFWVSIVNSGAAGATYGANGIWQVNRRDKPYGPSPHGRSWGDIPWERAMNLPGSTHVDLAKRLLTQFEWYRFRPCPQRVAWSELKAKREDGLEADPCAMEIPGDVLVVYAADADAVQIEQLDPARSYNATYFDPVSGKTSDAGKATPDERRVWRCAPPEFGHDWVLILRVDSHSRRP